MNIYKTIDFNTTANHKDAQNKLLDFLSSLFTRNYDLDVKKTVNEEEVITQYFFNTEDKNIKVSFFANIDSTSLAIHYFDDTQKNIKTEYIGFNGSSVDKVQSVFTLIKLDKKYFFAVFDNRPDFAYFDIFELSRSKIGRINKRSFNEVIYKDGGFVTYLLSKDSKYLLGKAIALVSAQNTYTNKSLININGFKYRALNVKEGYSTQQLLVRIFEW